MISSLAIMLAPPTAAAAGDVTPLGSSTGGRGKVVIGFDDGRRNVYENGFPIMAAAGVPGTVWMVTDTIGSEDYKGLPQLTETQLLELQAAGWEIGSHTTSHIDLSKIPLEDAIADMEASKAALESIGINCTSLAYPWGNYTSEVAVAGSEIYEWQRTAYEHAGKNLLYNSEYPQGVSVIGAIAAKNNQEAFAAIDRAVATDSVVILFWHSVSASGRLGGGSTANLHDIVDYIVKTGIQPITFSEIPRASRTTYVWDGEGETELASEAANWYRNVNGVITNDVAPTAGADVVWNDTSTKDCTWDLDAEDVTVHSWIMAHGYTGQITQGDVDIGIGGGVMIQSGKLAGNPLYMIYCDGNWQVYGGFHLPAPNGVRLSLTGANNCISGSFEAASAYVSGRYIVDNVPSVMSNGECHIYGEIDVRGKVNTFAGDKLLISGRVFGPGVLTVGIGLAIEMDIGDGAVDLPLEIYLRSNAQASTTVTMTSDLRLGSELRVTSSHATHSVTLDAAGHSISATGVTVGTRAAAGNGTVHTSAWDSTAGELLANTNVILADGGSAKLAPGQSFASLQVASDDGRSASWTMTATGTVAPTVTGLKSGSYLWYLDGVEQGEVEAGEDGTIALSYQSTGLHELSVKPTSMTLAMDGLAAAVGIVAVLAVLGGLFTMLGRLKF